ncbi:unnamed protein product [Callosobruchus maculatus]|uniref:Uncharacterized protein n=1 Tax=Callosobruchus maculatus TaxID=64391 RepID=A0A653D894_CALMS|nr:unnamed protein product [Callosobruchus maculatus]
MAANEEVYMLDESGDGNMVKRRSIFDTESDQHSNTTLDVEETKFPKATPLPTYPVEYVGNIVKETDQWKKLWKDSIIAAKRVKTHMVERKALVLQDSSFQKELGKLDALEADFKGYLTKAQHFCNQKIVEKRMNE